ncbi:hypothetical protein VOLCADRAFT_66930 [Volvox carteri f. nagariensis]|uniref:Protein DETOXIFICATION n=1 Tax=Volvox carteri f. nagariensis TaxID=3068 RepID=D8UCN7_VOLCA|nr:uncharacterized protein VOLCADRAFT_66930 [Volvox carteri f. nagariensis]EFJ42525.1 hypothetical protein VOLCADRAFT_66930 [Volvox carteri f. nagariensis]|eukprot:XP_002956381.1 hypothetical protein VOLCADRAFT_66930 [Volvox carteri f. nagariensis]
MSWPYRTTRTACIAHLSVRQVGHLGRLELSAVTLARSMFHITGLSLVVGMGSAVETFCGQAFGAAHYPLLGLVLQRAALICLLTCALPLALWVRADWVMITVMRQHTEVVPLAAGYVRMLWPALCCWAVSGCIKNYLSSQGVVAPLTMVSCIYTASTALLNHVFMFQFGLGMLGAAVAYNLSLLVVAMVWLHVFRQAPECRTWGGFRKQAFQGWGEYMRIALPSAAAICLDWWVYEAAVIIAGALPDAKVQLGAMGLAFDTHALLFMLVAGFSSAAATRVSNELGAGRGRHARFAAVVALALGLCAPLGVSGGLLSGARRWVELFTQDVNITNLVVSLMPVLTVSNLADSLVAVGGGVLRGSGRQELAFKVNLAAYWFLGLPLAAYLALRQHKGAMGLWLAMGLASGLQAFILLGSILRFDWSEEARKALRRVAASEAGLLAATAATAAAAGAAPAGPEDVAAAAAAAAEHGDSAGAASVQRRRGSLGLPMDADVEVPPPPPPPHVVLHAGLGSRHGVHDPLLTEEHTI